MSLLSEIVDPFVLRFLDWDITVLYQLPPTGLPTPFPIQPVPFCFRNRQHVFLDRVWFCLCGLGIIRPLWPEFCWYIIHLIGFVFCHYPPVIAHHIFQLHPEPPFLWHRYWGSLWAYVWSSLRSRNHLSKYKSLQWGKTTHQGLYFRYLLVTHTRNSL